MGEALLRSLDPQQVYSFLLGKNVLQGTAQKLLDEELDGHMLIDLDYNDLKDVVGILQAKFVKKKVEEHLLEKDIIPEKELPISRKKAEKQVLRKFGQEVEEGFTYTQGNFIPHETGAGSLLEPSRELKQFDGNIDLDDLNQSEIPFIKRVAQFSNACLNRRCNGTIYFGVADGKKPEHRHGQIVGLPLDISHVEKFEEWMKKYFRGNNSLCFKSFNNEEMKVAVDMAIYPIRVIPLKDATTEENVGIVLEIDVEPSLKRCGEHIFPIQIPQDNGKFANTSYYVRDGPASEPIPKRDVKKFAESKYLLYVDERREQESQQKLIYGNTNVKLTQLLCKSELFINDQEYKYFLIADSIQESTLSDDDELGWISDIHWQALFDFDPDSFQTGLGKRVEKNMLKPPKQYPVEEFANIIESESLDTAKKKISYGQQSSWLMCSNPEEDFKSWSYGKQDGINKAVNFYTHSKNAHSKDKLVFVFALFSDQSVIKMCELIKDIVTICRGLQEIVLLYQNEETLKKYQERLIENVDPGEWQKYSVQVSWQQLTSFVKANNQYSSCTELRVPSSSGIPVTIKPKIVDHFKNDGIEILGINHCEEFLKSETNEEKQIHLSTKYTQEFLTGKNPSWEIFMLSEPAKLPFNAPSALVERDMTNKIQEKLLDMANIEQKCVALAGILHNPGAGATTVGKHVLWKLKDQFRCAYLDGEFTESNYFERTARRILNYRNIGEKDTSKGQAFPKCKPLLLFLDNSSFQLAKSLRQSIEFAVEKAKISYSSTQVIILYAERSIDMMPSEGREFEEINVFPLRCNLDRREKDSFRAKLQLLKKNKFSPDDMLSFVIMAEDFNENSEYVKRVVKNNLRDVHPRQEKLLMVLAVYKYFADANLSHSLCDDYLGHSKTPLQERICFQLKPLVESKVCFEEGFGNYRVLHVTHRPVARQILNFLCERNGASEQSILMDFLDESAIQNVFFRPKTFGDMQKLLTNRKHGDEDDEKDHRKPKFSKIILYIENKFSPEKALDLLKKGYDTIKDDSNVAPVIAQTLARFLLSQKDFEEAKVWAQKAIDSPLNRFAFLDTMGQIYKHELQELKNRKKCTSPKEVSYAISVAKHAVKYFKEAQNLFESYYKTSTPAKNEDYVDEVPVTLNSFYFGEIDVNFTLSAILLSLSDNSDKKKSILHYIQGKNVEFEVENFFAEHIENWRNFSHFMSETDERTVHCMEKILNTFDSSTFTKESSRDFDSIRNLTKYREQRESMFFGTQFKKVAMSSKVPRHIKVQSIREALKCHFVRNMIYCLHRSPHDLLKLRAFIQDLTSLCPDKELNNEDKLCLLNVCFAEFYTKQDCHLKLMDIYPLSYQLAQLDLYVPEPYFYYMITHWPNEDCDKDSNTEYLETYDEEIMYKSIQKMKAIQEKRTLFLKHERSPHQRPFFFLAKGSGFSRLDIVPNGGIGYKFGTPNKTRKLLLGKKSHKNDKRITYTFPKGKEIEIRPMHYRWLRSQNDVTEVTFELGFTLEGPIAYNVKELSVEDERVYDYNNA